MIIYNEFWNQFKSAEPENHSPSSGVHIMFIDDEFWNQFKVDTGPVSGIWLFAPCFFLLVAPLLAILLCSLWGYFYEKVASRF
jgi:hypothetical protein